MSIHSGCLKGNFQYTLALEKEWHYTASSRNELENMPPNIFQYTPPLASVLLHDVHGDHDNHHDHDDLIDHDDHLNPADHLNHVDHLYHYNHP